MKKKKSAGAGNKSTGTDRYNPRGADGPGSSGTDPDRRKPGGGSTADGKGRADRHRCCAAR